MARYGYARVSTTTQDLGTQIDRLKAAGCQVVRSETYSGKSRNGRDELANLLEFMRGEDELVVVKLDRLGRSTRDVLNIVGELDDKGASLRVLEPELSTSGSVGRIVVTVLGMVAELEREFILDRQRAGIEAAKAKGDVYKGRPKTVKPDSIVGLKAEGLGPSEIARQLGISRMTVYRELKAHQAESA